MPEYKMGGHRQDPESDKYWQFNKKEVFGSATPLYSGDIDLREFSVSRQDQKATNSCVAHAVIKALEIKRVQKYGKEKHVDLSILDLYFGCRDLMDPKETDKDEGTFISLACDVLRRYGVCRESMHRFDYKNLYIPPPILATREAYLNKITAAYKIFDTGWDRVEVVKNNLEMGNPVCFGTRVGKNWLNYNASSEPLKPTSWQESKGLHATCILGYVDGLFVVENSWGPFWGYDGFAFLRPEVIADSASTDFWTIVSGSEIWYEGKK